MCLHIGSCIHINKLTGQRYELEHYLDIVKYLFLSMLLSMVLTQIKVLLRENAQALLQDEPRPVVRLQSEWTTQRYFLGVRE